MKARLNEWRGKKVALKAHQEGLASAEKEVLVPHHHVITFMEQPRKMLHSPHLSLKSDVCVMARQNGESERDRLHPGSLKQEPDILRLLKKIGNHVPLSNAFVGWRLGDMSQVGLCI